MRFSFQLPTDRVKLGPEYGSAEAVMEMARAAEDLGFGVGFPADSRRELLGSLERYAKQLVARIGASRG